MVQNPPAPLHGFKVRILSVTPISADRGLPHDILSAKAQVLESYGLSADENIILTFGPCSLFPEKGEEFYILAKAGVNDKDFFVEDHPEYALKAARQTESQMRKQ